MVASHAFVQVQARLGSPLTKHVNLRPPCRRLDSDMSNDIRLKECCHGARHWTRKTELNMQAKPRPEWQQETALAANQEGVFRPKHLGFISSGLWKALRGLIMVCARCNNIQKPRSGKSQTGKTSMLAACHSGLREHDLLSWWEHLIVTRLFDTVPAARASLLGLCFLFQRTVMWKMSNLLCPAVSHCTAFGELYFQHLLVYGDHLALSAETSYHAFTERGQGFNG